MTKTETITPNTPPYGDPRLLRPHSLERMLIFRERHVGHVLTEYENHYDTHRPHRALEQLPTYR